MRDFTIQTYMKLILTLQLQGFEFLLFKNFHNSNKSQKRIVLRHDVDALESNSLQFAKLQYKTGIAGTYYFRIVSQNFNENIIQEIAGLGHEIGYHYETMDTCKGNVDDAYDEFCRNLEKLRKLIPVVTVCMHGSPLSKYDNRAIWKRYEYKNLGIIAEPYFDVDFDEVLYLTDTGRRWDGDSVNIRDKITDTLTHQNTRNTSFPRFHSTFDIINATEEGILPDKILMTFHPQRWTDKTFPWLKELVWQNMKNVGKYFLVKLRDKEEVGSRK